MHACMYVLYVSMYCMYVCASIFRREIAFRHVFFQSQLAHGPIRKFRRLFECLLKFKYVHTYIHTYIHTLIHACIHTYIHLFNSYPYIICTFRIHTVCMYVCMYVFMHVCMYVWPHIFEQCVFGEHDIETGDAFHYRICYHHIREGAHHAIPVHTRKSFFRASLHTYIHTYIHTKHTYIQCVF